MRRLPAVAPGLRTPGTDRTVLTAMTRPPLRWIVFALPGLLLAACTSRTIPLPPPSIPPDGVSAPMDGLALVRGTAHEGATIGIINERTRTGVITVSPETGCESTCPFEAFIEAEPGDSLTAWQFFETTNPAHPEVPGP